MTIFQLNEYPMNPLFCFEGQRNFMINSCLMAHSGGQVREDLIVDGLSCFSCLLKIFNKWLLEYFPESAH